MTHVHTFAAGSALVVLAALVVGSLVVADSEPSHATVARGATPRAPRATNRHDPASVNPAERRLKSEPRALAEDHAVAAIGDTELLSSPAHAAGNVAPVAGAHSVEVSVERSVRTRSSRPVAHDPVTRAHPSSPQLRRAVSRLERQRRVERKVTQLRRMIGFAADDSAAEDLEVLLSREPTPFAASEDGSLDTLLSD